MEYRTLGQTGSAVSMLGLGGHKFHDDGRMKGLGDDFPRAAEPGYRRTDFGGRIRAGLVSEAVSAGVNLFDVTIDPEVEALGRNLGNANGTAIVQMRPQGFCYDYEYGNAGLADWVRLFAEVDRLIELSGLPEIGILNFAFEWPALASDPGYLAKVSENIAILKQQRKIRFAACDGLWCGEAMYLRMMEAGCFDVVWVNFSPLCPAALRSVLPLARQLNIGVLTREAFAKGELLRLSKQCGIEASAAEICGAALRWIAGHEAVDSIVVGVRNASELLANVTALGEATGSSDAALVDLMDHPVFRQAVQQAETKFLRGVRAEHQ